MWTPVRLEVATHSGATVSTRGVLGGRPTEPQSQNHFFHVFITPNRAAAFVKTKIAAPPRTNGAIDFD